MNRHHFNIGLTAWILLSCRTDKNTDIQEDTSDTSVVDDTAQIDSGDLQDSAIDTDSGQVSVDCSDRYESELTWFEGESAVVEAELHFAQTHVITENEARWAPTLNRQRRTGIFIQWTEELTEESDVRISAWRDGVLLGVLPVGSPSTQPPLLEQSLTDVSLEPWYLSNAWYVMVPYFWVSDDIQLKVGYSEDSNHHYRDIQWPMLASEQPFTISRSKMLLFGDRDFDTHTIDNTRLSQDFHSVLPTAELRWVDSAPWVLDEIVVNSSNGPVLVSSEDERLAVTSDPDRWGILKLIFTHRMSLANIGQGSINTNYSGGNSPFSFGTSIGLGWVRNGDGVYVDLNNAPYSAGWTGWTSIWHGECGNVFNHEVGHSLTMAHFTTGSAASWGIDDQYPLDGTNLESHPWGFDSTRNMIRTWYRVDANGAALDDNGDKIGKRDSMNGGESANSMNCFPQYTGYHGWKAQNWMNSTPTIMEANGQLGYFQWNMTTQEFEEVIQDSWLPVVGVDLPVATIIGSLGNSPEGFHLYPPIYWPSGNLFELPSPTDSGWDSLFDNAQYFVRVSFEDGSTQDVLINHSVPTSTDMGLFSFNIDLSRQPTHLELFESAAVYPNIDVNNSTSLYSRSLAIPALTPVVLSGKGYQSNSVLKIEGLCETEINCDVQSTESLWQMEGQIYFSKEDTEAVQCAEEGSVSQMIIPVENTEGQEESMVILAQRVVKSHGQEWHVSMEDQSPWSSAATMEQGIRLWAPYELNSHLSVGMWSNRDVELLNMWKDGSLFDQIAVEVNLEILDTALVDLTENPYETAALMSPGSSTYFIMTDPNVGPTNRVWWGDYNPTMLSVPVVDESNQTETLMVRSYRKTCNQGWGTMWQLNSAQVADDTCTYQVYVEVDPADNAHLASGMRYHSPNTQPIVFEGRLWHGPVANGLVGRFPMLINYTMPE